MFGIRKRRSTIPARIAPTARGMSEKHKRETSYCKRIGRQVHPTTEHMTGRTSKPHISEVPVRYLVRNHCNRNELGVKHPQAVGQMLVRCEELRSHYPFRSIHSGCNSIRHIAVTHPSTNSSQANQVRRGTPVHCKTIKETHPKTAAKRVTFNSTIRISRFRKSISFQNGTAEMCRLEV